MISNVVNRFNAVACAVCKKPPSLSPADCLSSRGASNPLCRIHGKCRVAEKTIEQLNYVLAPLDVETYLRACPGSGKTEVVGLKAAYAMRTTQWRHQGMAILTFTNNAADVIRERVSQFISGSHYPHFVGTFDGWLHAHILNPFAHLFTGYLGKDGDRSVRIVDRSSQANFLFQHQTKYAYAKLKVKANQFYLDLESNGVVFDSGEQAMDTARSNLTLADWQQKDLANAKAGFWKAGFATHQDVETICYSVLRDHRSLCWSLATRFPCILIDECQDLSWSQLQLLDLLRAQGAKCHLVGDLNQAIYSFRRVCPDKVQQFITDKKFTELALTQNFRSVQPIVDLCGKLVSQGSIAGRNTTGTAPACVLFCYDKDGLPQLASKFQQYLKNRCISTGNSAILARGHSTVHKLHPSANRLPATSSECVALAICLWRNGGGQAMKDALTCAGRAFARMCFHDETTNARSYDCPESYPSVIEWRLFLARVLDKCINHATLSNLQQTWKTWVASARSDLGALTASVNEDISLTTPGISRLRAPKGGASEIVQLFLGIEPTQQTADLRVTTFHQVKGETLDAVLVVSAPDKKSQGGHWTQWLDRAQAAGEHSRFAYVASSRPRVLLAWAVPEVTSKDRQTIETLGFVLVDWPLQCKVASVTSA